MSKKNLLNETTIRRFMKLADIGPLSEDFLPETEEELYEEAPEEEAPEEEAPEEELEAEVEVEEEPVEETPEGETVSLEDLKKGLQALVDAVPGLELEVEGEEEPEMGGEEELEMGGEEELEMGGEEELEMGGEEELEMGGEEEEAPAYRQYEESKKRDQMANRIVERVMKRLSGKKKKNSFKNIDADVLAERVMKRLTKTK